MQLPMKEICLEQFVALLHYNVFHNQMRRRLSRATLHSFARMPLVFGSLQNLFDITNSVMMFCGPKEIKIQNGRCFESRNIREYPAQRLTSFFLYTDSLLRRVILLSGEAIY